MSDNLPDIYTPESDADDIYTPERLDNSADIHTSESDADDIYTLERLDNSLDIHVPERSSTCNNQESILKQAKLIRDFGITYFSFMGIIILLIIVLIVALFSDTSYTNSGLGWVALSMEIAILVLGIIFWILDHVLTIIAIVKIKNTDWGNKNINNCKEGFWITILCFLILFWFILPLDIISPIMCIIWSNKVKNTYSPKHKHNRII